MGAPCMRSQRDAYDRERARERALLEEAQRQFDRASKRMLGDVDEEKR